jgi:hypothetical protein
VEIEGLVKADKSLGTDCAICESSITRGESILSAEKKIGVGPLKKTLRYEAHLRCMKIARDHISRKISEAEGL